MLSVALSATSRYMATGDSAGVCKTWDVAALMDAWTAHGCDARPADGAIVPVAAWRAHSRSVTSICAMGGEEAIFVSSSLDCTVATWHVSGSHVGTFGTVRCSGIMLRTHCPVAVVAAKRCRGVRVRAHPPQICMGQQKRCTADVRDFAPPARGTAAPPSRLGPVCSTSGASPIAPPGTAQRGSR